MQRNKVSSNARRPAMSVKDSLRPIAYLNAFLGMAVHETPSGQSWPRLSILYSLLRSGIYATVVYCTCVYYPTDDLYVQIMGAVFLVITSGNVWIAIVSTILGFINFKRIQKFYKSVAMIDETLQHYGIEPAYEATRKENTRIVIGWAVFTAFIFIRDVVMGMYIYGNFGEAFVKSFTFVFPLIINPIVELNFSVKISMLGTRFKRLNSLVETVAIDSMRTTNPRSQEMNQWRLISCNSRSSIRPLYSFKNLVNVEMVLKTVRQLHLDLCATSRKANATCSKQMSMQTAASFLLLTGFTYCSYLIYKEPRMPLAVKIQHYSSLVVWIVVNIYRMLRVIRTSVNVAAEAQKTSQIAHEIQVPKSQTRLMNEINQLSLQIMQHPLTFTASGMIDLNFGYVRGFVGSVTTYLMILIQNQPDMIKAANTLAVVSPYNTTTESVS